MELVKKISDNRYRFDSTFDTAHYWQGKYHDSAEELDHRVGKEELYEIVCLERKDLYIGKWKFNKRGFAFSLVVYGLLAVFLMTIVYWLVYS